MEKKRLYIAGAGGFGREVAAWARDFCQSAGDFDLVGFLDDRPDALGDFPSDLRVVGNVDSHRFESQDRVFVAICEPRVKMQIVDKLKGRAQFATIIHPMAIIGSHCKIGVGSILCPHAALTTNVTIGDHVHLNLKVTVGHDSRVGSFSTLNSHTDITGAVVIEEAVFMGSHAVVLPRGHVGAFARIGAGSVVLRHVAAGETVLGVPAHRV
ncbi:MAG TPA: acetyltransferase [Pirellulales bacterium]|jgi:sugar O-acyltransferase (sialic acid O-acetyltransferase NeuD family)